MKSTAYKRLLQAGLLGTLILALPMLSGAEQSIYQEDSSAKSQDTLKSEAVSALTQPSAQLIQELEALPTGKTKRFYRQTLKERGYKITTIKANDPEEFLLGVKKNDQKVTLAIQFAAETGKSTALKATPMSSISRAGDAGFQASAERLATNEKTETADEKNVARQVEAATEYGGTGTAKLSAERQRFPKTNQSQEPVKAVQPSQSEEKPPLITRQTAEQAGVAFERMVEELKALPVGKEREFYQQALKERGYKIVDSRNDQDQTEFSIEKEGHNLRLTVQFDKDTGKSTNVNASGARLAGI